MTRPSPREQRVPRSRRGAKAGAGRGRPSSGNAQEAPDGSLESWLATRANPRFRAIDAFAVVAVMLVIYAVSAPRTVTLEDSGIFIMSTDVAGISHPPGYPLHGLLGKLFTLVPIGSVAFRVHLVSACFGALTAGVLLFIAQWLGASRWTAFAVAFAYGLSREFWAQAIIAEVYSLNAFLFFSTVALALVYLEKPDKRTLSAGALVAGLGMSHHWPLYLLSLPGVLVMMWPRRRQAAADALRAAPYVALGLLPYVYLAVRSNMDPPISFYGPLDSWERFSFFVLRRGYAEVDASATAGFRDRLLFTGFFCKEAAWQMTPWGALLAAGGFVTGFRRWPRCVARGLTLSFVGGSLVLLLLLKRDFAFLEQAVFKVYPLIPYGIMALWLGLAIDEAARAAETRFGARRQWVPAVLGASVVAASLVSHGRDNLRAGYTWARDYAATVLAAVEHGAIIITTADSDTGPLGYLNRVERVRPDVEIYNDKGLVFSNRLFRPPASERARVQAFRHLVETSGRPVYVTGELALGYPTEDFGFFKKLLRAGEAAATVDPRVLEHCRTIEREPVGNDMWTIDHRNVLLVDCGRLLGPVVHLARAPERERFRDVLDAISRHLHGKIGVLEGLAERGDPNDLLRRVGEAEALLDESSSKQARGRLLFIRGYVENRKGATAAAIQSFRRSVDVYPDPRNGAVLGLLSLYAAQRRNAEYQRLRETMYAGRVVPASVQELDRTLAK